MPACAELCPTGALSYGYLPEEDIANDVEGFPHSRLGPAIKIVPWRDGLPPQQRGASATIFSHALMAKRASLRTEWPLLVFTIIMASLFAVLVAQVVGEIGVNALVFLSVAVLGVGASSLHLGKKQRAWRSVLNVAQSWLSREAALVALFLASGGAYLLTTPRHGWLGWIAVLLGLGALLAMDMVYRFAVGPGSKIPHSASMVLTGPLLAGVLLLDPWLVGVFGSSKAILYCLRKLAMLRAGRGVRPWVSAGRMGLGLVAPTGLWIAGIPGTHGLIMLGVLIGEFIDRTEFYADLDFQSPRRQMLLDLAKRVNHVGDTRSSKPRGRS
jgi:hypothetical protein